MDGTKCVDWRYRSVLCLHSHVAHTEICAQIIGTIFLYLVADMGVDVSVVLWFRYDWDLVGGLGGPGD